MSSVLIADGPAVFFFAGLAFGAAPALRAAAFGFAAVIRLGVVVAVFLAPSVFCLLLTQVPQFALRAEKLFSDGRVPGGSAVPVGGRRGAM